MNFREDTWTDRVVNCGFTFSEISSGIARSTERHHEGIHGRINAGISGGITNESAGDIPMGFSKNSFKNSCDVL